MKTGVIKNIIKQGVCWILLLQVINISIDPHDFKQSKYMPVAFSEDFSSDEIESISELIAENIFHKEVPPGDEDEIETSSPPFEFYFYTGTSIRLPALKFSSEHVSRHNSNFPPGHQEALFQPPKQA